MTAINTTAREKAIIMQAESVLPILNTKPGVWPAKPIDPALPIKFNTRRVCKENAELEGYEPHVKSSGGAAWIFDFGTAKQHQNYGADGNYYFWFMLIGKNQNYKENLKAIKCPYPVGTRLWVRETCFMWKSPRFGFAPATETGEVVYMDDPKLKDLYHDKFVIKVMEPKGTGNWVKRSSIHMPRWASRITLEVTAVRVERVQDISEADAKAEGIKPTMYGNYAAHGFALDRDAIGAYQALWNSINGKKYPWASNPWVWIYEFKRIV